MVVHVLRLLKGIWVRSLLMNAIADGVEFNLPPSNAVNVFGTEELPILLDMRGRLKDTNEDISEVSVTVKDAGGAAVSGGMFVFRDALVEAAKTAGSRDLVIECVFFFRCGWSCGVGLGSEG